MQSVCENYVSPTKRTNKRLKLRETEFTIPIFSEYKQFQNINYPVSFLKEICKNYKLKISGNKPELRERIYKFLYETRYATFIQQIYRGYLVRLYYKLIGPALYNPSLCMNETDFFSLESITNIPIHNFFSYKQGDGIWGFNLVSIYNLFAKAPAGPVLNPYTREIIATNIFINVRQLIRLANIFAKPININLNVTTNEISNTKKNEIKCLELFHYINELGNYSNYSWFMELSRNELHKLIRELADIWEYRAQLMPEIKREICAPYGDPFRYTNMYSLRSLGYIQLQKICLKIIEQFIKKGTTHDHRVLGASYVLCGLTLVNHNAAIALPWLYQSVSTTG